MKPLNKKILEDLYTRQEMSSTQIANKFDCSANKINYWLKKYNIKKRSISDAAYAKANPEGNPFVVKKPKNLNEAVLYGLGIGLYWGEGTKKDQHAVRLGNTDPELIKVFLNFLYTFFEIKKSKLRFGLQVFSDMDPDKALRYWRKTLGFSANQFMKVIVTPARSIGTYREKTKHGVLTVYFGNRKLRDIMVGLIENQ